MCQNREFEVKQMQGGQAHGRGAKLIILFDVSNGRTWKDFLGSGREGRQDLSEAEVTVEKVTQNAHQEIAVSGIGIHSKL